MALTVALAIGAPLGSSTVPVISPLIAAVCPMAAAVINVVTTTSRQIVSVTFHLLKGRRCGCTGGQRHQLQYPAATLLRDYRAVRQRQDDVAQSHWLHRQTDRRYGYRCGTGCGEAQRQRALGFPRPEGAAGRLHDLGERCATLTLEQAQDRGLLAAVARCGGLVASLGGFPLGSLGRGLLRVLRLLALLCRCLGLGGPLRGLRGRFRRAAAVQALDRFPDPADRRLPVRELLYRSESGDAVPKPRSAGPPATRQPGWPVPAGC